MYDDERDVWIGIAFWGLWTTMAAALTVWAMERSLGALASFGTITFIVGVLAGIARAGDLPPGRGQG